MSIQITDTITPGIRKALNGIRDRKPVLEAMGLELVSITKRAFVDSNLRAAVWAARKSGGDHPLLRKSGALWHSISITRLTNDSVTAGSDRVYAAIQQLGSKKKTGRGSGIPARPFFPFLHGKMTQLAWGRIERVAAAKVLRLIGG